MRAWHALLGAFAALAVGALPWAADAQPRAKVYRIGFLSPFGQPSGERTPHGCPAQGGHANWRAMLEGLRERGYVPGQNVIIECRFTEGRAERAPVLAAELVRPDIDTLVVVSTPNVRAAKQATSTMPIVFVGVIDPVGRGIVASLARPGGNVTGLADDAGTQYMARRPAQAARRVSVREHAEAGALIVYDVDRRAIYRRIGLYADRIFKGAKPADLPVEQPTDFNLIVNLSGARALGVVIPQSLLVRADEVIP